MAVPQRAWKDRPQDGCFGLGSTEEITGREVLVAQVYAQEQGGGCCGARSWVLAMIWAWHRAIGMVYVRECLV